MPLNIIGWKKSSLALAISQPPTIAIIKLKKLRKNLEIFDNGLKEKSLVKVAKETFKRKSIQFLAHPSEAYHSHTYGNFVFIFDSQTFIVSRELSKAQQSQLIDCPKLQQLSSKKI